MPRFAAWWNSPDKTAPSSVAAAAAAAGSLVETGHNYVIGSFDFGDGGLATSLVSEGLIVRSRLGEMWLVRPGANANDGWVADHLTERGERRPGALSRHIGAAHSSAGDILAAVKADASRTMQNTEKRSDRDRSLRVDV